MKLKSLSFAVLTFACLFVLGSNFSLEARHHRHVSFNVGTTLTQPSYPQPYIVQRRIQPVYVQPVPTAYYYQQPVVVYPAPVYEQVVAYPRPSYSSFSFGWSFWR